MPDRTPDDEALRTLLVTSRRIAVVGASPNPARPSHGVFASLLAAGYDAVPVNPVADEVLGVPAVADLAAAATHWAPSPIDIVDVFRAPDHVPEIVDAAIAAGAKAIWFQLGVVHEGGIQTALEAGLDVVVDRCIKIEHARLC